ncbi:MAG: gamma-glutamyl-gamma-aminobutyrate hydrolase family protein [Abditibacteriota bacterium]|nr:gamma-glutamyl-gamma-aminobutyrate hydrolase family protein [Abditibacteriota bacterium]
MKPVIGVLPLWDEKKESVWMLPGYTEGIDAAGGLPIILPFTSDVEYLVEICRGFLFTGGQDVSPTLYGEEPLEGFCDRCEKRDALDGVILKAAMEADKPILGICRGIQFINAYLGGTLYQDLPTQHPSEINHRGHAPYREPVHDVNLTSPLRECLNAEVLPVNSYHHQAVKTVAPGLEVMAVSTDGIVEAVYRPESRFLWAVQWHPEFSYKTDVNSMKIFETFIKACKERE